MTRGAQLFCRALLTLAALLISQANQAPAAHSLAVLPFQDRSGFKGQWDLGNGIPQLLSMRLAEGDGYQVSPHDSVKQLLREMELWSGKCEGPDHLEAIFDSLKVDILICGSVEKFRISRFGIAAPSLGGFESYRAVVQVNFALWRRYLETALLEAEAEGSVDQKGLGLTFLGRPTEQMEEYEMLEQLEFGSPLYMSTIAGEATQALLTDMVEKIQTALPPQSRLDSGPTATILLAEEGWVYINHGYEDGVRVGDEFVVYTRGEELRDPETNEFLGYSDRKVGRIRVTFVKSTHLSQAEVVEEEGEMAPGDVVRTE